MKPISTLIFSSLALMGVVSTEVMAQSTPCRVQILIRQGRSSHVQNYPMRAGESCQQAERRCERENRNLSGVTCRIVSQNRGVVVRPGSRPRNRSGRRVTVSVNPLARAEQLLNQQNRSSQLRALNLIAQKTDEVKAMELLLIATNSDVVEVQEAALSLAYKVIANQMILDTSRRQSRQYMDLVRAQRVNRINSATKEVMVAIINANENPANIRKLLNIAESISRRGSREDSEMVVFSLKSALQATVDKLLLLPNAATQVERLYNNGFFNGRSDTRSKQALMVIAKIYKVLAKKGTLSELALLAGDNNKVVASLATEAIAKIIATSRQGLGAGMLTQLVSAYDQGSVATKVAVVKSLSLARVNPRINVRVQDVLNDALRSSDLSVQKEAVLSYAKLGVQAVITVVR